MNIAASYMEFADDSAYECRARERQVLLEVSNALSGIRGETRQTIKVIEAVTQLNMLWTAFLVDLNSDGNGLSEEVKLSLRQIGFWMFEAGKRVLACDMVVIDEIVAIHEQLIEGLSDGVDH